MLRDKIEKKQIKKEMKTTIKIEDQNWVKYKMMRDEIEKK